MKKSEATFDMVVIPNIGKNMAKLGKMAEKNTSKVTINTNFEPKIVDIFLPIIFLRLFFTQESSLI